MKKNFALLVFLSLLICSCGQTNYLAKPISDEEANAIFSVPKGKAALFIFRPYESWEGGACKEYVTIGDETVPLVIGSYVKFLLEPSKYDINFVPCAQSSKYNPPFNTPIILKADSTKFLSFTPNARNIYISLQEASVMTKKFTLAETVDLTTANKPVMAAESATPAPPQAPQPVPASPITQDNSAIPVGGTGQSWAVIIGVSSYKDSRIPSLRYATSDAKSLYTWLTDAMGGRYAPSNVRLLLDEKATANNIRDALFNWLAGALEEDTVLIYYAGHGTPQSPDNPQNLYLLPSDADYDNVAATAFPMWDIETALKRFIKAKKVIIIGDACHAGGVGQSFDMARRASRSVEVNPISTSFQSLSAIGDGICVISAADEKQLSQEGMEWGGGHGVFTYYLLQALYGQADYNKDGSVTLGELIPYLSEQVRRATKNAQCPTVAGKFDPALSIKRR